MQKLRLKRQIRSSLSRQIEHQVFCWREQTSNERLKHSKSHSGHLVPSSSHKHTLHFFLDLLHECIYLSFSCIVNSCQDSSVQQQRFEQVILVCIITYKQCWACSLDFAKMIRFYMWCSSSVTYLGRPSFFCCSCPSLSLSHTCVHTHTHSL